MLFWIHTKRAAWLCQGKRLSCCSKGIQQWQWLQEQRTWFFLTSQLRGELTFPSELSGSVGQLYTKRSFKDTGPLESCCFSLWSQGLICMLEAGSPPVPAGGKGKGEQAGRRRTHGLKASPLQWHACVCPLSIGKAWVIWPHLPASQAVKCTQAMCQEKTGRTDFSGQLAVSTKLVSWNEHWIPGSFS